MGDDLSRLDAVAQAELVRTRKASPAELVDAAIDRIERVNPKLNAVIHRFFERAREQARDGALPDGPFRGVPFLLKDLFGHTQGDPMHFGARFLKESDFRVPHDSYLAGKFRAAGLVFLGRTNVPELGILPTTESDAYGPARNPWNPEHSTGGSSGGSAAAVASGMVPAAHANDGGGSIRIPASECGLVGLKPSRGRTSFGPDIGVGVGGLGAEGVVTRTVRDTAALLDVAQGYMPGDPYTAPPPARPYRDEIGASPGRLRIGVMTTSPAGSTAVHPECLRAAEQGGRLLAELGHTVDAGHPDALDDLEVGRHFSVMYAVQLVGTMTFFERLAGRPLGPSDFDPFNWALSELGRGLSVAQYIETEEWIAVFTRRVRGGRRLRLLRRRRCPAAARIGYFKPDRLRRARARAGAFVRSPRPST
jgi:amidase